MLQPKTASTLFPYTTLFRSTCHTGGRSAHPVQTACGKPRTWRSEEHTSELQSRFDLVCRLLLEKRKPLIKERILVIILLLHFLSLMLGSVLVLMLPLLVWLT